MVARPETWSRSLEPRHTALVAALSVGLFFAAWGVLHEGFYARGEIRDTGIYHGYGTAMADGEVPYRDFDVAYPPAALPVFLLPALGDEAVDEREFRHRFEPLMMVCGAAALAFMAFTLAAVGASRRRATLALAFAALSPLALGSVVLSRFDLWPAALTAAAVAALLAGRERIAFGVLAAAAAAKGYPAVLFPLAVAYVWRRLGRREAAVCSAAFLAVLAAWILPFLVVAPGGFLESVARQLERPLQIESLGAAVLFAAHHVFGFDVTVETSHGSQNLTGAWPVALAVAQAALQVGTLVAAWASFARRRSPDPERLLQFAAATVCLFVALGRVLSPQFLIWLVPLVPLVRGRRGLAAASLLAIALMLTQSWFPYRYWDFALRFDETASWLVLARDLVLVALAAVLLWPESRGSPGSAARPQ